MDTVPDISNSQIDGDRWSRGGSAFTEDTSYSSQAGSAGREPLFGRRLGAALAFLLPAVQFFRIQVVGALYASDLFALGVLMIAMVSDARVFGRRLPRTFLTLGAMWLLAQIITDLIRATAFHDYSRGWAMIVFFLMNFAALYVLLDGSRRRIVLCALGFAVGDLLTYRFSPDVFSLVDPWKFGYGYAVCLLLVLVAVRFTARGGRMPAVGIMMAAAGLNLYHDYRSLAGECFVAAAYLLLAPSMQRRSRTIGRISAGQAIVACVVLGLSAAGLLRIYAYCAGNGLLGYAAWQKYEIQSSGRYGVLIGGRGGILTSLEAVTDSPIVGYGSWAKDWRYASRENAVLAGLGYETEGRAGSWLIPAHSYLVGAWVHAGVFGALFWLWVFTLPVRVLMRLHTRNEPMAPLLAFLSAGLIWNALFSPFGGTARLSASFAMVTLMSFLEKTQDSDVSPSGQGVAQDEAIDRYDFV